MSVRAQFLAFQKYCVYYGPGELERLSRYDVAVVEPLNRTKADLAFLRSHDTLVLAYVSVMEVHPSHPMAAELQPADYLWTPGSKRHPLTQPVYGSRLLNLVSPRWRGILVRHIGQLLAQDGYDGIFLDTIGDVERPDLADAAVQMAHAISLVEQLRRWFPEAILVQNNGLEMLCLKTAAAVDGFVWENPPLARPASRHWVNAVAERLKQLRDLYGVRVLVLYEGPRQDTRAEWLRGRSFASEHQFTAYFAPEHYQAFHA
ncbi:MAG: endo alpha-1,4 polygalactosaminidase [Alicyclobacillus sp.]|nr:endo alpha-1,4 polygalactosaminidase [Alicyclobacillus sp.]